MKTRTTRQWLRWERIGASDYGAQTPAGVLLKHDSEITEGAFISVPVLLPGVTLDAVAPQETFNVCEDGDPDCGDSDCERKHRAPVPTSSDDVETPQGIAESNHACAVHQVGGSSGYATRVASMAAHLVNVVDTARERRVSAEDGVEHFLRLELAAHLPEYRAVFVGLQGARRTLRAMEDGAPSAPGLGELQSWLHAGMTPDDENPRFDLFQLVYARDPYPCDGTSAEAELLARGLIEAPESRTSEACTWQTGLGRRLAVFMGAQLPAGADVTPMASRPLSRTHMTSMLLVLQAVLDGERPDVKESDLLELRAALRARRDA